MNEASLKTTGVPQARNVTFELHTLGWEGFQNLCGHIAQEILGQTVTVFSPSNDLGQDGGFQGVWTTVQKESYAGRLVIQCKFTALRDEHLSLSQLKDEIAKATKLGARGEAETYLLITNAKLSGASDSAIREAFGQIAGIKHFDILGVEWITQQILKSKRLRAFVPRIYGLGDLSQILDERVYHQADEILQSWKDNLAKFVPTDAHERSVKALLSKKFALLLGDPMAGKSTIAAALALAASDQWGCRPIFVSRPEDFRTHWNPSEPKQMFWVDDAFGQTQFEPALAEGWNRQFPLMATALRKGACILFTSRTYVFNSASRELKKTSFPLLADSQVIIEVERLTVREKERILYNHLRLGNQPPSFKKGIKPFLPAIAADPDFFPEVASRLGDSFFTKDLHLSYDSLKRFVSEPKTFLGDIIEQLDRNNFAALALLFMRGGKVTMPLDLRAHEVEALTALGTTAGLVREAFGALVGSLVGRSFADGERYWKFRHPTVRDAMASHVANKPDLIDIYLHGVEAKEALVEVVCAEIEIAGAKVHVPPSRYSLLIDKLAGLDLDSWNTRYGLVSFLSRRCSKEFIRRWAIAYPDQWDRLFTGFKSSGYGISFITLQLFCAKALPETDRQIYVQKTRAELLTDGETTFLMDEFRPLFTQEEFTSLLATVVNEFIPNLTDLIDEQESRYDHRDDGDPHDYFHTLRNGVESIRDYLSELPDDFSDCIDALEEALEYIDEASQRLEAANEEREDKEREQEEAKREYEYDLAAEMAVESFEASSDLTPSAPQTFVKPDAIDSRNIFDDVDI